MPTAIRKIKVSGKNAYIVDVDADPMDVMGGGFYRYAFDSSGCEINP